MRGGRRDGIAPQRTGRYERSATLNFQFSIVSTAHIHTTHEALPAPPAPRRWHVARKAQVVIRLRRGESLDALSRELALPIVVTDARRFTRPLTMSEALEKARL